MIYVYKGDDTIFGGVQKIAIDLRGVTMPEGYIIEAHLCGEVVAEVSMPTQTIAVVLSAEQTAKMACGLHYIRLVAYDTAGKRETFASIPLNVTTDASKTSGDYIVPSITAGLNPASKTALGVVRIGDGIEVGPDGTISVKGGGGGTSDYNDLENKPKIGGVELAGDKSADDLGLASLVKVQTLTVFVNNAQITADKAKSEASDANNTAQTAQIMAESARDAADAADYKAQRASDAAIDADTGKTALELANEAKTAADSHVADRNNPHGVTAEQSGALPSTGGMIWNNMFSVLEIGGENEKGEKSNGSLYLYGTDGSRAFIAGGAMSIDAPDWNPALGHGLYIHGARAATVDDITAAIGDANTILEGAL